MDVVHINRYNILKIKKNTNVKYYIKLKCNETKVDFVLVGMHSKVQTCCQITIEQSCDGQRDKVSKHATCIPWLGWVNDDVVIPHDK